ncbi:hypothetical protein HPB52_016462 [Rhipicephalus sanguineus]|uniref:Kelch repeat protein n=1 Tax=Rhipicephalus sanguineus TaxID=34632 RepID=A0A9D4QBF4_RHISA|nr:hypothetical protein HPB52_016462 [Rhipicephalus sanguineus]
MARPRASELDARVEFTGSLRWTLIPVQSNLENVPFQRFGHTVVGHGEYAYLWGGRNEDGACSIVYRFDTSSLTWLRPRTTGETPAAREGHSACVVAAACTCSAASRTMPTGVAGRARARPGHHALAIPSHQGQCAEWRSFHSAVAIGRRMYVWGGRRSPTDTHEEVAYCDRLAYLDTTNGAWVHPVPRAPASGTVQPRRLPVSSKGNIVERYRGPATP